MRVLGLGKGYLGIERGLATSTEHPSTLLCTLSFSGNELPPLPYTIIVTIIQKEGSLILYQSQPSSGSA